MKLLTKDLMEQIPPIYSQQGLGDEAIVQAKFFTPWTYWTWYVVEGEALLAGGEGTDDDWVPLSAVGARAIDEVKFFGLVRGHEEELGYFVLSELEDLNGPWGLKVERDLYWDKRPLSRCRGGRL